MHYAIFTSAIVGTIMLFIILEQLGIGRFWLTHFVVSVPLSFATAVGLASWTKDTEDFFVSGRRVPSAFNGFAMAVTSMGGTGLLAAIGTIYFIGFDGLALIVGWAAAFVLLAVLFFPYLRKFGTYTIPSFFAMRFNSQLLRIVSTFTLIPPLFLLLAAELKIGAFAASFALGLPTSTLIIGIAAISCSTIILGGMRSLTWSQSAHFIIVLIGFIVPLTILSVLLTNLPLPQLTYGTLLDELTRLELSNGLSSGTPASLHQALPGDQGQLISNRFFEPFSAISQTDFLLLAFCFMIGTASLPGLLTRANTTTDVYESRKTVGWGIFLLGIFLVTIPAYAVFAKYLTLQNLVGATIDQLPAWSRSLMDIGLIEIKDQDQNSSLGLGELFILRDGIALAFPIMAQFPFVLIVIVIVAAISAALAGAAVQTVTIGNMISEDIFHCLLVKSAKNSSRIAAARISMIIACILAAWLAITKNFDSLHILAWSLSVFAGTLFAPLMLSIWWRRFNKWGAVIGIVSGFGTTAAYIWIAEMQGTAIFLGIDSLTAAAIGLPVSFIASAVAALVTPKPKKAIEELIDDMRMTDGETIFDRALRIAAQKKLVQK